MSWSALVIAWACPVCFRVEDGALTSLGLLGSGTTVIKALAIRLQ